LRRSSGTLQGLRKQLPWPDEKPFRILSIDGGGIRGILPATILSELEDRFTDGNSAGNYFDLITGTSTGGIIALGLSVGLRAKTILNLYMAHGREVFPKPDCNIWPLRALRLARSLGHHAYDPEPLEKQVRAIFRERIVG
jgi:patatin-like phospholipase/acyl hydrolase